VKQVALGRYEQDNEGNIVVDVSAESVDDLYSDFDRSAPYIRRDLDRDFAGYLVECVRELNRASFIVRLNLAITPSEPQASRIRRSLNGYFVYLMENEKRRIHRMFRRSAILFTLGLGILFVSVWLNRTLGPDRSMTANVFAQGLTVAAWVSLWEALVIFLIGWFPHRKNVALYRRLAHAGLVFRSAVDADRKRDGECSGERNAADRC